MKLLNKAFQSMTMLLGLLVSSLLLSCTEKNLEPIDQISDRQAQVIAVQVSGQANDYTLSVTIKSPDTGCDQYADWWEVVTQDGTLVFRRILAHSHVSEQPFTRSGGKIKLEADDFFYVRAHMNNLGYGTTVFGGSVSQGLNSVVLEKDFAATLASTEPLPTDCAF